MTVQVTERIHTDGVSGLRLVSAMRDYIPHVMAAHGTPGLNIALAHKGKLIWEAGFGLADVAADKPMTPDTTYRSGSLGKTYTATAIMILVDRGVIALDDPINRHLPFEVHNPLGKRDITVHDLMVHKSGLAEDAALPLWAPGKPLADMVQAEYAKSTSPIMRGMVPRWSNEVGAAWCYSNLALATLGLIVEAANPEKLDFSTFVQRHVMDPLRMTHSQYPPAQHPDYVRPKLWELLSTGYARMGAVDIPTIPLCFGEFPAGGVVGLPADHVRLLLAMINKGELDNYRLFEPGIAEQMLSPATDLGGLVMGLDYADQGLMWRINAYGKPNMSFDHGGGHMFGWRTQGRGWPNYRAAVMIAVNQYCVPEDSKDVEEIANFVGNWLRFEPPVDIGDNHGIGAMSLSYVRGALLAAAYHAYCGVDGIPPQDAVELMIRNSRPLPKGPNDWDADAFRRGFHAMYTADGTMQGSKDFWNSADCEVEPTAVWRAYLALGGREQGAMSNMLPDRPT